MPREAWVMVKAMVTDTYPDIGLPGPQPPFPPRPGSGGPVDPGYSPPWAQAPVDPGYSPPWARPGPPLGIWGPPDPRPTPPIYIPITPPDGGPPIYIPVDPGYSPPWAQVPNPNEPHPSNPIMKPGTPGWEENMKIALAAKVKAAIDFWTGHLPESPVEKPTPV